MIEALAGYINIVLSYFYNAVGDYGIAIIMLTAVVNIITFPLTRKQIQASKKLQDIQPELKKLQEKYKHDKQKYNQVTMEFMRDNKVNPLGGCLPLLVQFPIIIAVFHLLRDPTIIAESVEFFDPTFLFFGLDLTKPDPFYILPIMAAGATFFHQRLVLTDPKQKVMLYIFPVMIMVISVSFASGLVLYWLTNSLFSIGNHFIIRKGEEVKKITSPEKEDKKTEKNQAEKAFPQKEKNREAEQKDASVRKKKKQRLAAESPSSKKKTKGKKKGAGKSR